MKSDESADKFLSGFNCAQSVFLPFAQDAGLSGETGARIASSFGAGMARTQATCGAVTGGLMALGLEFGFAKPDDQARRDLVLSRSKAFLSAFEARFGTLLCKELLGCDLNTEEGQRLHRERNQRELLCVECVKLAASLVEASAQVVP